MKFAVGYQLPENNESMPDIIRDYKEHISELYFSWVGSASGRAALGSEHGAFDWGLQERLECELREIKALGPKLDLLFNANCYGGRAVSISLENEVMSIVSYLYNIGLNPDIITTASPFIATVIKKYCPDIEVRASVNMKIGSTTAIKYLSDSFDSFYVQRDIQRNIPLVKKIKKYCDANNKKLLMLLNSGCLRNCPAQIFHDNMVAHNSEIDQSKNVPKCAAHLCWKIFAEKKKYVEFLKESWIRPEDLYLYDDIIAVGKLASRLHPYPRMLIAAYINRVYNGNLLNLLEPGHATAFMPYIIDNQAFPENWHEIAAECADNCSDCGKCEEVLQKVMLDSDTDTRTHGHTDTDTDTDGHGQTHTDTDGPRVG